MIHEWVDIAHWKSVFQLDRLREQTGRQPEAGIITGPYDIAVLEQLRERSYGMRDDLARVPTDVFVWNRGEPETRAVTKIAGLPYREAGRPWPIAPSGVPLNFVAQFNFADSRDLTPALPSDVLLIFAEGKEWKSYKSWPSTELEVHYDFAWGDDDERDSAVTFEWVRLGDFPLVSAAEIPATGWRISPYYAAIHRTWDYPDADGFAYPDVAEYIDTVLVASKIGGFCPWIQGEEDMPGEFLCSLSSMEIYRPFPFLNVPGPISDDEWGESHTLMFGDVGLMYLFVNTYGHVRWAAQGH